MADAPSGAVRHLCDAEGASVPALFLLSLLLSEGESAILRTSHDDHHHDDDDRGDC